MHLLLCYILGPFGALFVPKWTNWSQNENENNFLKRKAIIRIGLLIHFLKIS